jgi:3-oxoacyl-[acyl-carrier protein] reductase
MSGILEGKNCVVSGGSRGIGRAIVERFVAEGASVYYLSRSEAAGPAPATEAGKSARFIACDVSSEADVEKALAAVIAEAGSIDVLVNNAGITRDGLVFRMSLEDWNAVIATNLTATFLLSRTVARYMIKKRSGSIINISSIVGIMGNGGQTNYAASKAGVIGFTKSLAREVASRGVRVNALAPGFIDTDMSAKIPEEAKAKLLAGIPLGRAGRPEEVAAAALFLASEASSYITGEVIKLDGGMGM